MAVKKDVKIQKEAMNDQEQYIRHECLEFSGIPEKEGEDIYQIIVDISQAVGVDITEDDISVSHRLPSKLGHLNAESPKKIIAKFTRREIRDKIYRVRKGLSNKTTKDIEYRNNNKIYISESLIERNKELLKSKKSPLNLNLSGPITVRFT